MTLQDLITDIHKTYLQSVLVLSAYVSDVDRAIQELQANHLDLVTTLVTIRTGPTAPLSAIPTSPGARMFEVEASLLDSLIDIMKVIQGHKEKYPTLAFRMYLFI
jgi:hypothetical protein